MAVDHALNGCQSEAGAGEFALGVQALEGTEQSIRILGVEPGAVVAYLDGEVLTIARPADLDARRLWCGG